MAALEFQVPEDDAGIRVDLFLCRHVPEMSRAKAKALAASGGVRIDGRRSKKGDRVATGQTVTLDEAPPPTDFDAEPNGDLALVVLHEDAALVVVNKPAGMPMHPLRPEETDTLCNALVARYPEMAGVGYKKREPGIVHRLDNDTSGLVIAARTAEAFDSLVATLSAGELDKRYLAIVVGAPRAPQTLDAPIGHEADRRKVRVCFDEREVEQYKARPALTELLTSTPRGDRSLVEVRAPNARRHQVRAHLAAFGYPLVGDSLYGGPEGPRHLLHANQLAFDGPAGRVDVQADLPDDFQP